MRPSAVGVAAAAALLLASLGACSPPVAQPEPTGSPAPQPAPSDPGARALLEVVRAERSVPYSGWRCLVSGPRGVSRETRMYVVRSPSDRRTVVEWTGSEGARRWQFRHRFRWIENPGQLLENYRVEEIAGTPHAVAFRETRHLRVSGRRPGRPTLDLYVDTEHGVILEHELRDHTGEIRSAALFESIEFGAPEAPPDDDPAQETPEVLGAEELVPPPPGFVPLDLTRPPEGFLWVSTRALPGGGIRAYFTDGLAAFVVQQRPATPQDGPAGEVEKCSSGGFVRLAGVLGNIHVDVRGALPAEEIEAAVRSFGVPAERP